jgi:UDP-2-acetamido-2,6-beta-L-arabino-hexul-4-ose reductase
MNVEVTVLEKHTDQRGALLDILRDNEINGCIKQVYFSISNPGTVRGNHYHLRKIEWLSVIKGSAKMICEDIVTKVKKEIILSDDKPTLVKVSPFTSHAIKNIGNEDMYLLVAASEVFDPINPDVTRDNLL